MVAMPSSSSSSTLMLNSSSSAMTNSTRSRLSASRSSANFASRVTFSGSTESTVTAQLRNRSNVSSLTHSLRCLCLGTLSVFGDLRVWDLQKTGSGRTPRSVKPRRTSGAHCHAAVDGDDGTGHIAGLVGGQEPDDGRHFLGGAEPPDRGCLH